MSSGWHTEETKRKLSEMRRGDRNPFYGKKHTPEALAKMANARRLRDGKGRVTLDQRNLRDANDIVWSYVAGLIDGEGSITKHRKANVVYIYNTSSNLMEWLLSTIGGKVRYACHRNGRSPCHVWIACSVRNVHYLLSRVIPFLVIKKDKANSVIAEIATKYHDKL